MVAWLLHRRLARSKMGAELRLVAVSLVMFVMAFYISFASVKVGSAAQNLTEKYGNINQASFRVEH